MQRSTHATNKTYSILLGCGVVGPLLKVGTDILAGCMWIGYRFTSRSISDLSAIGAPTRALVVPLDIVADLLLIAFAMGVWRLAGGNRRHRLMAVMILPFLQRRWLNLPMCHYKMTFHMSLLIGLLL